MVSLCGQLIATAVLLVAIPSVWACLPGEYECPAPNQRSTCHDPKVICDRTKDCYWGNDEEHCDVIPEAQFYCETSPSADGYYPGRSVMCYCRANPRDKDHRGTTRWFSNSLPQSDDPRKLKLNVNDAAVTKGEEFECKGISGYNQTGEAKVKFTPKFSYLDDDSVTLSPKLVTFCQDQPDTYVTCRVHMDHANMAPLFKFTSGTKDLSGDDMLAEEIEKHYNKDLKASGPPGGGEMNVTCHVSNVKFPDQLKQEVTEVITFRRPPTQAPMIKLLDQEFQGSSDLNLGIVTSNFTGELTCEIMGGFPAPKITSLSCGNNEGVMTGKTGIVRFQNSAITQKMDRVICRCVGGHASGCYDDHETTVKIRVKYPGVDIVFDEQTGDDDTVPLLVPIVIAIILSIIIIILIIVIVVLIVRRRGQQQPQAEQGTDAEQVKLQEAKA